MSDLEKTEKELFDSVERGEWTSVESMAAEIQEAREYARGTQIKDQRMNIRISKRDMDALKIRAMEEGIPYQTLVSSVLHKYVTGRLTEKKS